MLWWWLERREAALRRWRCPAWCHSPGWNSGGGAGLSRNLSLPVSKLFFHRGIQLVWWKIKRMNMNWSIAVATSSKDFIKNAADTFWAAAEAVVCQPVSTNTAAFCSKGSQRLAEVHTVSVVHVTSFCYNWREQCLHSFKPVIKSQPANSAHQWLRDLWGKASNLESQ